MLQKFNRCISYTEYDILERNHRFYLTKLLKLHEKTPESFILFAAGCLSAEALVHLRVLGLFGMICRLPLNILHRMADNVLSTENNQSGSWFVLVRTLCTMYHLPSPLLLLSLKLSKENYKQMIKGRVISFWECKLRSESKALPSLKYFDANFASLSKPHPILTTPASNPYEVNKSVIQLLMISGRYRDDRLMRYWSPENKQGTCKLCSAGVGNVEHYLKLCLALTSRRQALFDWWLDSSKNNISLTNKLPPQQSSVKTKLSSKQILVKTKPPSLQYSNIF